MVCNRTKCTCIEFFSIFFNLLKNKHFEGSCELLSINFILMLMNCKICAKSVQSTCKLCTISVPTLCKNTAFCTSRVAFIAKTAGSVYCTSITKSVSVQVYTKPVNCASVHKTTLLYKCTQKQFNVQVYT